MLIQAPVPGGRLVSRQGPRPSRRVWHNGIDLSAPEGTTIFPVSPGTVAAVCVNGSMRCCGYGNGILVRHEDDLYSWYAHMKDILAVEGQEVGPATPLGTVGTTFGRKNEDGDCVDAPMSVPHLHLEIVHAGWPFGARNYTARYDVLEVFAASGLRVDANGALVTTDPFEYREPLLAEAMKSAGVGYEEEIAEPWLISGRGVTFGKVVFWGSVAASGLWLASKLLRRRRSSPLVRKD